MWTSALSIAASGSMKFRQVDELVKTTIISITWLGCMQCNCLNLCLHAVTVSKMVLAVLISS